MAKNDFQYGGWNSYTLQCGTITTLISSGDCTLQCGMWLWNRDSEFTKWQHPAMWHVALGWHATEFAKTSAILEFYIWFPFSRITAVDMSFLDFRGPIINSLKSPCTTSNRSLIETIGLNCLVFEKIAFLHFGIKIQDSESPPSWILEVQ